MGLSDPIVGADGRSVRVKVDDAGVQLWAYDADSELLSMVEQPVALLPGFEVSEERYRSFVDGVRLAIGTGLERGEVEVPPADLFQPDVLRDPAVRTAEDVARVLWDPVELARIVGPMRVGAWLAELGLSPVPDATAALLYRFQGDDLESALDAARELVAQAHAAARPALLATLESWVEYVDDPIWFTDDDQNAHAVLANTVASFVGNSPSREDRLRVVALFEAGLVGR